MNFISWILVGLLAGFLAKFILPSKRHKGFIRTVLLGVIGGLVGGYIGQHFGLNGQLSGFNEYSVMTATLGALFVLIVQRLFAEK